MGIDGDVHADGITLNAGVENFFEHLYKQRVFLDPRFCVCVVTVCINRAGHSGGVIPLDTVGVGIERFAEFDPDRVVDSKCRLEFFVARPCVAGDGVQSAVGRESGISAQLKRDAVATAFLVSRDAYDNLCLGRECEIMLEVQRIVRKFRLYVENIRIGHYRY